MLRPMTEVTSRLSTALAGRYEIERELGAGGMATVYLAHDVKHSRKVALKVLKPELAAVIGAERFLNEIKVTANLQHPNILALYDSGEADSFLYYVMPLVEGESLRERLDKETQLSVDAALQIAQSVAAALGYAHRNGVVHRDIKPENILLHEGQALVADFGIALAVSHAGGARLTETGLSVGTPHYMSPEQAMGDRELDGRSDIYSLGSVTYEMLVGEPPHTGPSAQAIIAKIVTDVPRPVTDARPSTPDAMAAAIEKALEKLPADRFATAEDFSKALTSPVATTRTRAAAQPRRVGRGLLVAAGVVAVAAFLLGRTTAPQGAQTSTARIARFAIPTPEGNIQGNATAGFVAISPDGNRVAYVVETATQADAVFVRHLGSLTATPVPGTEEAGSPVFSPDGESIAYQNWDGSVRRVRLDGGTAERVAGGGLWDVTWSPDGSILLGAFGSIGFGGARLSAGYGGEASRRTGFGGILRVPPVGDPELLTVVDTTRGEIGHYFPQVLPGDRHVLLAVVSRPYIGGTDIAIIDHETDERSVLVPNAVRARYVPSGHLVWAEDNGRLRAAPFDLGAQRLGEPTITLAQDVSGAAQRGFPQFDVSDAGDLVYLPAKPRELVIVDRAGRATVLTDQQRVFHSPRISPDGRLVAVDITDQTGRFIWTLDVTDGTLQKVTFEGNANDPVWSPDGRYISFGSVQQPGDKRGVSRVRADGAGTPEMIFHTPDQDRTPGSFFPGGDSLVSIAISPLGWQLEVVPTGGTAKPSDLPGTRPQHAWPAVSPDGKWIAYQSDESGVPEVYVRPIDGSTRTLVSLEGGVSPVWHPSGRELFYRHSVGTTDVLVSATVDPGPPFRVTDRMELFSTGDYELGSPHANYDVHPDGERFIMLRIEGGTELVYIQNWTALFDEQ